jgi:hypothetical protein
MYENRGLTIGIIQHVHPSARKIYFLGVLSHLLLVDSDQ